jgi:hypothetical protein
MHVEKTRRGEVNELAKMHNDFCWIKAITNPWLDMVGSPLCPTVKPLYKNSIGTRLRILIREVFLCKGN